MWPLLVLADYWMQGNWTGPLVGSSNKDVYGNTIAVGSIVKFVIFKIVIVLFISNTIRKS